MNIYYTAKDIEELAAKGITQIEIGAGTTLTDFARETAQQLNITLVQSGGQNTPSQRTASPSSPPKVSGKYNKPAGCQHTSNSLPITNSHAAIPPGQLTEGAGSTTVNSLIDLMGKAIKRGG